MIGGNDLTGTLPKELTGLKGTLKTLDISGMGISGTIPTEYGLFEQLEVFDAGMWIFRIEFWPCETPCYLQLLSLVNTNTEGANVLVGSIPTELGLVESLVELKLRKSTNLMHHDCLEWY